MLLAKTDFYAFDFDCNWHLYYILFFILPDIQKYDKFLYIDHVFSDIDKFTWQFQLITHEFFLIFYLNNYA